MTAAAITARRQALRNAGRLTPVVYRSAPLYRKPRKAKVNPMPHLYAWLGVLVILGLFAVGNWGLLKLYGMGM